MSKFGYREIETITIYDIKTGKEVASRETVLSHPFFVINYIDKKRRNYYDV